MSKIKLEFNSQIVSVFKDKKINVQDGILYLLSLYYNINSTIIPDNLKNKILACNIVTKDYSTGEIVWKIPLFEEQIIGFEWITEYMDLFKKVNPERRGVKKEVLSRMKKFFINNPAIRQHQVMEATRLYLKRVDNPVYCKKSHKFIYEQDGTSMLLDFVTQLEENKLNLNNHDVI